MRWKDLIPTYNNTNINDCSAINHISLIGTYLTEVTRMVLIHQDSVVMLTTGITTTTRVSTMLADTTVTGAHVTSLLSVVV